MSIIYISSVYCSLDFLRSRKNSVEETGTKDSKLRGSTQNSKLPSDFRKLKGTEANSTGTSYMDKSSILKQNSCGRRKSVTNVRAEDHFTETDDNDIQTDSVSEQPRDFSPKGIFVNGTDTSKSDLKAAPDHSGFCLDVDEALDNPDEFLNVLSPKGKCIPLERKSTVFDNNVTSCSQHDAVHLLHGDFQKTAEERSTDDTVFRSVHSRHCSDDINHSWQWLDGNGTWIDYPESVNSQINRRLLQRPTASVVVEYNEQIFRIVASKMIQINTESKEKHEIRRKIQMI
uniref:WWE domain-containing protein n=1 Tax=Magallana gigas TaxID=29159 RepID=A0A8W8HQ15_MAGGI